MKRRLFDLAKLLVSASLLIFVLSRVGLQETSPGEHVGLREMRERVELVGGHFAIASQPGEGTLVVAEVPLPSAKEGDSFNEH